MFFHDGGSRTTQVGFVNRNSQECHGTRDVPGNDHGQYSYKMMCRLCCLEYGANGSDVFQRKCPRCQGGEPGISF